MRPGILRLNGSQPGLPDKRQKAKLVEILLTLPCGRCPSGPASASALFHIDQL
ncbi:hypothetical protein SIAM614_25926 [Stappia aggregata IAM 12614]|uniref:Uncharacterized protein n=1 Tax=Roseibium aggregatum (strain ATCC 25650 / DSM 13394 / JCM 20685 / NBRC 16684 / NCIMB 2208 / IAM 12614 / B1) TaxID=384765 RepID=A0NZS1_ROSAI|nr:hypothetical protein SIAM614_25926 [Stappia aggregata IAM 12614] [Roseibium aggregatum IAM 12614]